MLFADWKREYKENLMDELDNGLSIWEFASLVLGLSPECRFWNAVQKEPKKVTSPEEIAALTGSYLGPGGNQQNTPQQDLVKRRGVRR